MTTYYRDMLIGTYLGPVYTMDHEVVLWRSKSVDWLLKLSHGDLRALIGY